MGKIIARGMDTYIILPREEALLYCKFNEKGSFELGTNDLDVKLNKIISKDVKKSEYLFKTYAGEKDAQVLFGVFPGFYRGKIDPDKALKHPKGLGRFLGKESYVVDPSDESIVETAREIAKQLPYGQRENPYALTDAITHWIKGNIEYVIIPKKAIERVAGTLSSLPKEDKTDVYKILKHSFNIKEDILRKIAKVVCINEAALPSFWQKQRNYELAKDLMNKVNDVWRGLQLLWLEDDEVSAKKTLENKAGKCIGMSYLFVALSRNLSIPSRQTNGYCGPLLMFDLPLPAGEGEHAWAASYMHPFGWVEVDPTFGQFQNFNYDSHAYHFSPNSEHLPKFTMFERGEHDFEKSRELKEAIRLLENEGKIEEKRNWLSRLIKRKTKKKPQQYEEYIEFLKA